MKISAVKNINNCSHFKGIENKQETQTHECKNVKLMLGLVAVSSIALACVAIRNSQNNKTSSTLLNDVRKTYKKAKEEYLKRNQTKLRGPEAVKRYQYLENQRKMESLHQRLFNGEFKNKSPEALNYIRRNEINFAKATGRLK